MLDIFDILGPVMVGPSSSHTAGAVRIGRMARVLLGEEPVKAVELQVEIMRIIMKKKTMNRKKYNKKWF